jgi:hypothetical protein
VPFNTARSLAFGAFFFDSRGFSRMWKYVQRLFPSTPSLLLPSFSQTVWDNNDKTKATNDNKINFYGQHKFIILVLIFFSDVATFFKVFCTRKEKENFILMIVLEEIWCMKCGIKVLEIYIHRILKAFVKNFKKLSKV